MNRIVYTAIIGPYDTLREPVVVNKDWRYICFTTEPTTKGTQWEIVHVGLQGLIPVRRARQIKVVPPFEYDECLWMDGRVQILCDPAAVAAKVQPGYNMAVLKHPWRTNTLEESLAVTQRFKAPAHIVAKQMAYYRSQKFLGAKDEPLLGATGIIYRRNMPHVRRLCATWWDQICKFSHRDQLSLSYVCWAMRQRLDYLPFEMLFGPTDDAPGTHFHLYHHPKK